MWAMWVHSDDHRGPSQVGKQKYEQSLLRAVSPLQNRSSKWSVHPIDTPKESHTVEERAIRQSSRLLQLELHAKTAPGSTRKSTASPPLPAPSVLGPLKRGPQSHEDLPWGGAHPNMIGLTRPKTSAQAFIPRKGRGCGCGVMAPGDPALVSFGLQAS